MMKLTPGRPLLTFTYLRSLHELQPFFNTLCLANQSDNLMLAARQLGANVDTRQNKSNVITNGQTTAHSSNQSEAKFKGPIARGLPKSKSVPAFPIGPSPIESASAADTKTTKEYIEEVILRDFLEPMS